MALGTLEKNIISSNELRILEFLHRRSESDCSVAEIGEISVNAGITDSDETVRALYTLEGKSLVQPNPIGDFTSDRWQITLSGSRALQDF